MKRVPAYLCAPFAAAAMLFAASENETQFNESFEKGAGLWQPGDEAVWKIMEERGNKYYELTTKNSKYKPPHRSPFNFALLKDVSLGDFTLTAKVQTTTKAYGHRDLCFIFGYQDAAHFYYAHLGEKTDDHANQIFIVHAADRTKVSTKTTPGTPWKEDKWHHIKIERNVATGAIRVYFDDMTTPVMEATDKTFAWGQVGVGSFDDTGRFDDVAVKGVKASKPAK